ncbi:hypothetical protein, partial [Nitrospirillum bahiense]
MGKMLPDVRRDLDTQGQDTRTRPSRARPSRTLLLAGTSLLAMGTAMTAPQATAADTTITGGSTSFVATQSSGNLTLTNSGTLSGATALKYTDGTSFLINQGLIQGSIRGAYLAGTQAAGYVTLTTLVNTGSIVSAGNAIEIGLGNTLVSLVNSGMIQGNLLLGGDSAVTIFGGTGGATGTFTGVDGTTQGMITSGADLTLASGSLLLNDAVTMGGNTLVNSGASVILSSIVSVTGNYRQSAGELALGSNGELVVSGAATVTGGTVSAFLGNLSTSGNYVAGDTLATLIAAGSGSYSGITANLGNGLPLLFTGQGSDGSNLLAMANSDYIGGTLGSVTNTGSISALYVAATGSLGGFRNETTGTISADAGITILGTVGTLDNAGHIFITGTSGFVANGSIGTLINSGVIYSPDTLSGVGLAIRGTIGQLVNQAGGSINNGIVGVFVIGPSSNHGTAAIINTLSNSGFIGGTIGAVYVDGTIGLLENQAGGTITGGNTAGILVYGGISTLTNTGLIQSNYHAIDIAAAQFIGGTIGLLDNQAGGTIVGSQVGVANTVVVHTLVNSGIIAGGNQGVFNQVIIGTLENLAGGTITASGGGTSTAIRNVGIMGTLTNAGLIAGNYGLYVGAGGTLDAFSNSGTIAGQFAVNIQGGTVGTLDNSGTITGTYAVVINGTIGTFINGGLVQGTVLNGANNDLTIQGGAGGTVGTFTGQDGVSKGMIVNQQSDLTFSAGSLLLNDDIDATGHTVANAGASLQIATLVTITGAYDQAAGTLVLGAAGGLSVTGAATVGGLVQADLAGMATANFLVGDTVATLVHADGGLVWSGSLGPSALGGHLAVGDATTSTDLMALAASDYIGGTYGTLSIGGGTLLSAPTALYIAGTGTLGALANSGTIAGDITNDSARDLTILGGAGLTIATLTGSSLTNQGTITSTLANVVLGGGNLALNDAVNVGTGTLVNNGANLTLSTLVNVSGNYNQATGGLELGGSGTLAVSGAASITGGSLVSGRPLSATGNYLAGTILDTLVTGGAGSSYDGVTVTNNSAVVGGIGGIVSGDDLLLGATGNYIGGTYGSLANTGTLSGAFGLVVGNLGTLDTFSNSGLISVTGTTRIGIYDRGGSLGQLDNSGTIIVHRGVQLDTGATVGTIANSGSIGASASAIELYNARAGLITNTGTIAGTATFGDGIILLQGASVETVDNAGVISETGYGGNGIVNYSASTIGTVLNSGTIIAGGLGIGNFSSSASIGTLVNSGLISGGTGAILNGDTATIGTLINTGTLRAANGSGYALANHNGAVIGTLINAGVIAGTVTGALYNSDTIGTDFTIQGGDTGTVGTFIAWDMSAKGMIYNTLGNVTFTSGALLLHDDIYVPGYSVTNVAAALALDTLVTITGAYSQLGGTLSMGTAGGLSVTGSAGLAGLYQVTLSGNAGANYVVGDAVGTVVQADGGVSYSGSLTGTALDGHVVLINGTTSNQLLALAASDYIGGSYGTISVTGLLAAPTALYIAGTGSLGALANSGTIAGDIVNLGTADLTITGGTGGAVGTLTGASLTSQGTITSTLANVVLAGGSLLLNDAVNVGAGTLANAGATVSLSTIVSVTGNYSQATGTLALATGAELVVSGAASISGATVTIARQSTLGNYVAGSVYATLVAGGAGSSYTSVAVTTGSHALGLAGTVSNNGLLLGATGDYIGGSLGSLANSGTLAGHVGLSIAQGGQLGTFTNDGLISIGGGVAVENRGSIGLLENLAGGTITGTVGLYSGNSGTLSTLANAGLISGTYGVYLEYAQVTLLTNSGTLEALAGAGAPVALNLSQSTLSTLVNSGLVSTDGYGYGVNLNFATINTLVNQGTIAAGIGIRMAYASLTALGNSGTISGTTAIQNSYGVGIGTLVNSGTIMGVRAYLGFANASLGTLVNSGLIRGGIYNGNTDYGDTVAADLTIQGGAGGTVGTFTGQDGVSTGLIFNSLSNLVFASGALLLNDDVRANAHTVSNTGAALTLVNTINLTGAYSQSAGTLVLDGAAQLNVIGVASIASQVAASVAGDGTANYLVGDTVGTLVQASGGLTYAGTFVNDGALDGHAQLTVGTSGSELLALATTDYIGAGYGTVSVTGLLTGPTALYIAGTGSLGALANSGTIAGNIVNASANTLSITGGTSGTVGTLTGGSLTNQGTITSTLANVVLAGGSLLLNDAVNVGTGTLANAGAAVSLSTIVSVTGNYSQATGTLALATGAELAVSGAASIGGGTVAVAALSDTGNYLAGSIYGTLVAGGAGSDFSGATVTGSAIPGMGSTVTGNNLALFATGNYIGASYGSLSNSGTLAGAVALQVGGLGSLGTFRNSGLVTGAYRPILNYNTLGLLENQAGGTITAAAAGTLHQDTAAIYNGQFSSIGTITNAGLIAVANDPGDFSVYQIYAISNNSGTIGQITNSGTITGFNAIFSSGTGNVIGTIDNQGVISGRANINLAFSRVGLVTNSGTLSGYGTTSAGLVQISYATVGTIANSGLMAVDHNGGAISNTYGTIGTVLNQGTIRISGSGTAINNYGIPGTIGTIVNSGTILADNVAIQEAYGAALGTVINTGTIAAGVVIRSYGNSGLGTVANSGLIRGNLMNGDATGTWTGQVDTAVGDLTLLGGTGTLVGTFTGLTGKGLIDNRVSNLSIAGGNLLLNDDILATGHSVVNSGAALTLGSAITVTGTYAQSAGRLVVGNGNTLQADSATVTGGEIGLDTLGNYIVGQAQTVIGAATGTYSGATLSGLGTGSASVQGTLVQSGGALLAQFSSDYVGGSLVTLTNSGTITTGLAGILVARTGSVGTLINDGSISAPSAIALVGTVGSVLNTGVVRGAIGLFGDSTTRFANSGTITGAYNSFIGVSYAGLIVASSIGTLVNSGTISAQYALLMAGSQGGASSIGTLVNSGVIAGNIVNGNGGVLGFLPSDTVAGDLTIQGGTGGTVGTFTGQSGTGLIQNKLSNLVFSGGSLLLNDDVDVTGHTALNSGASLTLANTIDVTGTYVQGSAGALVVGKGGQLAIDGQATIAGQLRAGLATDNFLPGQQATLVTGSVGSDYSAATIASNLAQLALNNTIVNNAVVITAQNYYIGGSLGADITNTGTVSAATAVYIAGGATAVGTLVNSGVIAGNIIDDRAGASLLLAGGAGIGTFTGGTITHTLGDIHVTQGTIRLNDSVNAGTGALFIDSPAFVTLGGTVAVTGTLRMAGGLLIGTTTGLLTADSATVTGRVLTDARGNYLAGDTPTLIQAATADYSAATLASLFGLSGSVAQDGGNLVVHYLNDYVGAGLATLNNSGTLTSGGYGVYVAGTGSIGTLSNSGVLGGVTAGVVGNGGTIATLVNTGTINAAYALGLGGGATLGTLVNSGVIAGTIVNGDNNLVGLGVDTVAANLSIQGGGGALVGTFTGQNLTAKGSILNRLSDLLFTGGNLWLNDDIDATAHTVGNLGADLTLTNAITVTGAYSQAAGGTLVVGTAGRLSVTDAATVAGTVVAGLATENAALGQISTLVTGDSGSDYSAVNVATVTGMGVTASISGGSLLGIHTNYYVGGSLGSLANSGSISAATILYIAATGTLDTLTNSGTIAGNIINRSARILSISGGTGGAVGSFTGGTITNTASDLALVSGDLSLADAVNVTGHTLVNSGANVTVAGAVSVTGDYGQSAGTLLLRPGTDSLNVSGNARLTGGTVAMAGFSVTGNYFAGTLGTLVHAGGTLATGATVIADGVGNLNIASSVSGGDLLALIGNDYIGGTLGSLVNTDTIISRTALYVATSGGVGSLANNGTLTGQYAGLSNAGSIGTLVNTSIISQGGGTFSSAIGASVGIRNTGVIGRLSNSGLISAANTGLNSQGSIATLSNSGTITATHFGLRNNSVIGNIGVIDTLTNTGWIYGRITGMVQNQGSIDLLDNSGTISGYVDAVGVTGGTIGTLLNSGTLSSSLAGVVELSNRGSIAILANGGLISGSGNAITIESGATLGLLINSGTIAGAIWNDAARDLTIQGGSGTVGTFTGATGHGLISNTASNVVFSAGSLLLDDDIDATGHTVLNTGAAVTLAAPTHVTGDYGQSGGTLSLNTANALGASGTISISGGYVQVNNLTATVNYVHTTLGVLATGNAASDYSGAIYLNTVDGVVVGGVAANGTLTGVVLNDYIGTTYATLVNSDSIQATLGAAQLYVTASGSLGGYTNTGTLFGGGTDLVHVGGSVGTFSNAGVLNAFSKAIHLAGGSIGTLSNTGGIFANTGVSVDAPGTIGVLSNAGTIWSQRTAVYNLGSIGSLANTGSIATLVSGGTTGLLDNSGSITAIQLGVSINGTSPTAWIGTLLNSGRLGGGDTGVSIATGGTIALLSVTADGLITGSRYGVYSDQSIGTLANQGTIFGQQAGINNNGMGSIGLLTNDGTIQAQSGYGINNDGGTLGTLVNSGLIRAEAPLGTGIYGGSIGLLSIAGGGQVIGAQGVYAGVMNTLANSGTIEASTIGVRANTLDTLVNDGIIQGGTLTAGMTAGQGVIYNNAVGLLRNSGTISGGYAGVSAGGTTGTILNSGSILSRFGAVGVNGLDLLNNSGLLSGGTGVFSNSGVGSMINTGTVVGGTVALNGAFGFIDNAGLIQGPVAARFSNQVIGFTNSGIVAGDIVATIGDLSITGGSGTHVGTFTGYAANTQGTITVTGGNLLLAGGSLALNDQVQASVVNTGANLTTASAVTIAGAYTQAGGTLQLNTATPLQVADQATIAGGVRVGQATANFTVNQTTTLVSAAAGSDYSGATVGGLAGMDVAGTVDGAGRLIAAFQNDYVGGTLLTLSNTGSISANTRVYVAGTGSLGTLVNTARLFGTLAAVSIAAGGVLDVMDNEQTVDGNVINDGSHGLTIVGNTSQASSFQNGTIRSRGADVVLAAGRLSMGDVVDVGALTLRNTGATILSNAPLNVLGNYRQTAGELDVVANSGALRASGNVDLAGQVLVYAGNANILAGDVSTIAQAGGTLGVSGATVQGWNLSITSAVSGGALLATAHTDYLGASTTSVLTTADIDGTAVAAYVATSATIGTVTNQGTLSARSNTAVQLNGTIGILANTGLIAGQDNALSISGNLSTLANAGTIAGDILNTTSRALVITGGSTGTVGTVTGYAGGRGTITNVLSGLTFAAGNLLVNDDIDAAGQTVTNSGATLTLGNGTITGAFAQTGGTLSITSLTVSDAVSLTGGVLVAQGVTASGNYLASTLGTLVTAGAASSYAGVTLASDLIGLNVVGQTVGNDLLLVANNDYVGGTLATLTNSGTITAATAVYIAATGSLGTLVNTGTLSGDIRNLSANALAIAGNTAGGTGLLTGGTIRNTQSDLTFTEGALRLEDAIDVTGHTVVNSGANLTIGGTIAVTGNFSQTGGSLLMDLYGSQLTVSGSVAMAGGALTITGASNLANYTVGSALSTLVAGGAGADYAGLSITTDLTGFDIDSSIAGNALVAVAFSDYIGGTLGTLNNTGTISGVATGLYVASTGSLGTFTNTGAINTSSRAVAISPYGTAGRVDTLVNQGGITGQTAVFVGQGGILGTLVNSGTLAGTGYAAISNFAGTIGLIQNSGTIASSYPYSALANNWGAVIGTVSNTGVLQGLYNGGTIGLVSIGTAGTMHGWFTGLANAGTLAAVINDGQISGPIGVQVGGSNGNAGGGSMGTLTNAGTISGTSRGLDNLVSGALSPTIGRVDNSGLIASTNGAAIFNEGSANALGTLGTLANRGTIQGAYGVANDGVLGALLNGGTLAGSAAALTIGTLGTLGYFRNDGLVAGDIVNLAARDLTINNAGSIGTFTGYGAGTQGTIRNAGGNVVFASGALTLNDAIDVGSHTVVNSGIALTLAGTVSITGNYAEAGGTVTMAPGNQLAVSGVASINGAVFSLTGQTATGNYLAGTLGTVVAGGAGSDYSGTSLTSGYQGVAAISTGGNLVAVATSDYIGGSLASAGNSDTIVSSLASSFLTVASTGTLGSFTNSGMLTGGVFQVDVAGVIGTFVNAGSLSGNSLAFHVDTIGSVGTLSNSGVIGTAGNQVRIAGTLGLLSNSGTLGGVSVGGTGTLGTVDNSGRLASVLVALGGRLDSLVNTGWMGSLGANGLVALISNGGTISGGSTGINLTQASIGSLSNTGTISAVVAVAVDGSSTIGALSNTGRISSLGDSGTIGVLDNAGSLTEVDVSGRVLSLLNSGSIGGNANGIYLAQGGTIASLSISAGGVLAGTQLGLQSEERIGTLTNDGLIQGAGAGINNRRTTSTIDLLNNRGTIWATGSTGFAINNAGTIGTLLNSGVIRAEAPLGTGIYGGSIGLLSIAGGGQVIGAQGVYAGVMNTLANSGTIQGGTIGVRADTLDTLVNDGIIQGGTLTAGMTAGQGIMYNNAVGLLRNSGTISGGYAGVSAGGTTGTILNSGSILSRFGAVGVNGLDLLNNSGLLSGGTGVFSNSGIGSLVNTGTVVGGTVALNGAFGVIDNAGMIQGPVAARFSNQIIGFTNSGIVAGDIVATIGDLSITGGSGTHVGTFTGYAANTMGTITVTGGNVVFAGGGLWLNDQVAGSVVNAGSDLILTSIVSISGAYSQTSGTLDLSRGAGQLVVANAANITGGTVLASVSAGANYLAGTLGTLVAGAAGSTYTGATIVTAVTGLASSGITAGGDLLLMVDNDYIGGTLATLTNSGAVTAATALYIAASGNLGTLVNSGTLTGNIRNLTTHDLVVVGGPGGGVVGTLTGGTIVNSLSGVSFIAGNLLLADAIDVGGNTVVNSGANLTIGGTVAITGNYSQTGGGLVLSLGGSQLAVGGSAALTGGVVTITGASSLANYTVGSALATLVSGGAGSRYTLSITNDLTGFDIGSTVVGNDLLAVAHSDYIGGSLGSLSNTGTVSATTALLIANTGSLGSFSNSGSLLGGAYGVFNNGTLGTLHNAGLVSATFSGVINTALLGTLVNDTTGTVMGQADGVFNQGRVGRVANAGLITGATAMVNGGAGTIATIANSGLIQGAQIGLLNAATVGLLDNSGTLAGITALRNAASGTFGAIVNSGLIQGDIINLATSGLTIGGSGTQVGTLAGGTITSTAADVTFNTGTLLLADAVTVTGHTLVNSGATLVLNSIVAVTGNYSQTGGVLGLTAGSSGLAVSGAATLSGGIVAAAYDAGVNYFGGSIATLVSAAGGLSVSASITNTVTGLAMVTRLSGTDLTASIANDYIGGALGSLANTAALGGPTAFYVAAAGSVGTLVNSGTLSGTLIGLAVAGGQMGQVTNAGLIRGSSTAGVQVGTGGRLGTLSNSGTIASDIGSGVLVQGSLGSLDNSGQVTGGGVALGIANGGIVGSVSNLAGGTLAAGTVAVLVALGGTLGGFSNAGVLTGARLADVAGSAALIGNSGTLTGGASTAFRVSGTLGTLANSGLITAAHGVLSITSSGVLDLLANSGTIIGDITNAGARDLTLTGGGTVAGTFTGGTLTNLTSNVVLAGGGLAFNDAVNVTGHTLVNSGANVLLSSTLTITGAYSQTGGTLALAGNHLVVSGVASLSGGTVSTSIAAATNVNYLQGDILGTLVVGGAGSSYAGVFTQVNVTGLGAAASAVTIGADTDLVATVSNNYIGGSLSSLGNAGTIVAVTALYVGSGGSVGSVSNSGTLSGSVVGVVNNGTVGTLTNSGTVTGSIAGVANAGSVGSFGNDGSVSGSIAGVVNSGTIGTLGNTGTVTGSVTGLGNQAGASIGTLSNSGTVAGQMALNNAGTIEVVVNNGALIDAGAPTAAGLYNTGNIATVLNGGTILGATYGVYNAGTIGTLANSGLITAPTALYLDTGASLGVLANSGTVTGNILNLSANTLSITGGSGAVVGTLTGYAAGSQGTITNTLSNVVLASGNLLLNDAVNVTGHTLVNSGASVILDSLVSVTGAYSQTAGTLTLTDPAHGGLAVSGAASFSGGTVVAQYSATGNYLAGVDTLVAGGTGSSYSGVAVQGSLTGLLVSQGVVGTNLLAVIGNDYVGGTLGNLSNTGTLTAATV